MEQLQQSILANMDRVMVHALKQVKENQYEEVHLLAGSVS